jgi:hypothetical protein
MYISAQKHLILIFRQIRRLRQILKVCFTGTVLLTILKLYPSRDLDDSLTSKDLVLAFYYPWYEAGKWKRHAISDVPALGLYGTDENITVSTHISWASQNSVDGFILSWNGEGHMTDTHIIKGFLGANNVRETRFFLFYESLNRLSSEGKFQYVDFHEDGVYEKFEADLVYIRDAYFSHPSYLRLDGRPVIGLYVTRVWRNFAKVYLDNVSSRLGENVYFVGDEAFILDQSRPETALNGLHKSGFVFDAYMAYNMFEDMYVRNGESSLDFYERVTKPVFQNWCGKVPFLPTLLAEYKDFRGHKELRGTPEEFYSQITSVRNIHTKPLSTSVRNMYLVTSFNEWFEGTSIEPSRRAGFDYLNVIDASFRKR